MPIYSPLDLAFLAYTIVFLFAYISFIGFGALIISWLLPKLSHSKPAHFLLLSHVSGIVSWSLLAYTLGYLNLRFLMYVVVFLGWFSCYRFFKPLKSSFTHTLKTAKKQPPLTLIVIALGIFMQLTVIVTSGWSISQGYIFHRLNSIDGLMHLAFIQELVKNIPPAQPGAAGLNITNYHYLSNLFSAELARLFTLPINHLYFHYLPIIIVILIPLALALIVRKLSKDPHVLFWTMFLYYFAGNANQFVMQLLHRQWGFYTPAIDHGIIQFLNMPQAYARFIFLTAMLACFYWLGEKKYRWGVVAIVLTASLFGFKVYFGIFLTLGIGLVIGVRIIHHLIRSLAKRSLSIGKIARTQIKDALLGIVLLVLSSWVFFPTNKQAGGIFFSTNVWPKILFSPDNLNWQDWWLRMQVYELYGNTRNIIIFSLALFIAFIVTVYGVRVIGLIPPQFLWRQKKSRYLLVLLWFPMMLFMILGAHTLQDSGGANVFNFLIISLSIATFFAAFWYAQLQHLPKPMYFIISLVICLLALPRPIQDWYLFIQSSLNHTDTKIFTQNEIKAFEFLKNQPANSTILAHPSNKFDWETPYLSTFTHQYGYRSGQNILESHNQPLQDREETIQHIIQTGSPKTWANLMNQVDINFFYIDHPDQKLGFNIASPSAYVEVAYQDESIIIVSPTLVSEELE